MRLYNGLIHLLIILIFHLIEVDATLNGEEACEGHDYNETECLSIGDHCCDWQGSCFSNISQALCHDTPLNGEEACQGHSYNHEQCMNVGTIGQDCCQWEGNMNECHSMIGRGLCGNTFYTELYNYEDDHVDINGVPLQIITGVLSFILGLAFIAALFFVASILFSTARNDGFNLYLAMLIIPDMLLNGAFSIQAACKIPKNEFFILTTGCKAFYWLLLFYWVCNTWINAVVAYKIHNLILRSYKRMRTRPPSPRESLLQCGSVYIFSALVASWYIIDTEWSPVTITKECSLIFGSNSFGRKASFSISFTILLMPILYVTYVRLHTWWRRSLPIAGRTRAISLFFLRILLVFFFCYIPSIIILVALEGDSNLSLSAIYILSLWDIFLAIQTFVTLGMAMTKPDLSLSVRNSFSVTKSVRSKLFVSFRKSIHNLNGSSSLGQFKKEEERNGTRNGNSPTEEKKTHLNEMSPDPPANEDINVSEWEQADIYCTNNDQGIATIGAEETDRSVTNTMNNSLPVVSEL